MPTNKLPRIGRFLLTVGIVLAVAGCGDQAAQIETSEPTLLLIPATPTVTPSPIPPTPTSDVTESPGLVIPVAPTAADTAVPSDAPLIEVDPIAGELVFIAQGLVADQTGLPTRRIRVVSVEAYLWRDSSLGCPIPGQINSQLETPGYRIVLAAGENEYLFHTDVDRVLACDPVNEVLPDPLETTPEATSDSN